MTKDSSRGLLLLIPLSVSLSFSLSIPVLLTRPSLAQQAPQRSIASQGGDQVLVCPHDPNQRYVPQGSFIMGSTREEREYAYGLDREVTRAYGWYERETRRVAEAKSFCIDRYPVTNLQYQRFLDGTGRQVPHISPEAYRFQGFLVHSYKKVEEFLWRAGSFPPGRDKHPVVLVSVADARSYCLWQGKKRGGRYRLPTEEEWEKASRGRDGSIFPWGNRWEPERLNSGDRVAFTTPVGLFPQGNSPYGLSDTVGNTFEWTSSPWPDSSLSGRRGKRVLKGCSWDDLPGTCRSAMRHGRPSSSKHILIGFRCVSAMHH